MKREAVHVLVNDDIENDKNEKTKEDILLEYLRDNNIKSCNFLNSIWIYYYYNNIKTLTKKIKELQNEKNNKINLEKYLLTLSININEAITYFEEILIHVMKAYDQKKYDYVLYMIRVTSTRNKYANYLKKCEGKYIYRSLSNDTYEYDNYVNNIIDKFHAEEKIRRNNEKETSKVENTEEIINNIDIINKIQDKNKEKLTCNNNNNNSNNNNSNNNNNNNNVEDEYLYLYKNLELCRICVSNIFKIFGDLFRYKYYFFEESRKVNEIKACINYYNSLNYYGYNGYLFNQICLLYVNYNPIKCMFFYFLSIISHRPSMNRDTIIMFMESILNERKRMSKLIEDSKRYKGGNICNKDINEKFSNLISIKRNDYNKSDYFDSNRYGSKYIYRINGHNSNNNNYYYYNNNEKEYDSHHRYNREYTYYDNYYNYYYAIRKSKYGYHANKNGHKSNPSNFISSSFSEIKRDDEMSYNNRRSSTNSTSSNNNNKHNNVNAYMKNYDYSNRNEITEYSDVKDREENIYLCYKDCKNKIKKMFLKEKKNLKNEKEKNEDDVVKKSKEELIKKSKEELVKKSKEELVKKSNEELIKTDDNKKNYMLFKNRNMNDDDTTEMELNETIINFYISYFKIIKLLFSKIDMNKFEKKKNKFIYYTNKYLRIQYYNNKQDKLMLKNIIIILFTLLSMIVYIIINHYEKKRNTIGFFFYGNINIRKYIYKNEQIYFTFVLIHEILLSCKYFYEHFYEHYLSVFIYTLYWLKNEHNLFNYPMDILNEEDDREKNSLINQYHEDYKKKKTVYLITPKVKENIKVNGNNSHDSKDNTLNSISKDNKNGNEKNHVQLTNNVNMNNIYDDMNMLDKNKDIIKIIRELLCSLNIKKDVQVDNSYLHFKLKEDFYIHPFLSVLQFKKMDIVKNKEDTKYKQNKIKVNIKKSIHSNFEENKNNKSISSNEEYSFEDSNDDDDIVVLKNPLFEKPDDILPECIIDSKMMKLNKKLDSFNNLYDKCIEAISTNNSDITKEETDLSQMDIEHNKFKHLDSSICVDEKLEKESSLTSDKKEDCIETEEYIIATKNIDYDIELEKRIKISRYLSLVDDVLKKNKMDTSGDIKGDINGDIKGDINGDINGDVNKDINEYTHVDTHADTNADTHDDIRYNILFESLYIKCVEIEEENMKLKNLKIEYEKNTNYHIHNNDNTNDYTYINEKEVFPSTNNFCDNKSFPFTKIKKIDDKMPMEEVENTYAALYENIIKKKNIENVNNVSDKGNDIIYDIKDSHKENPINNKDTKCIILNTSNVTTMNSIKNEEEREIEMCKKEYEKNNDYNKLIESNEGNKMKDDKIEDNDIKNIFNYKNKEGDSFKSSNHTCVIKSIMINKNNNIVDEKQSLHDNKNMCNHSVDNVENIKSVDTNDISTHTNIIEDNHVNELSVCKDDVLFYEVSDNHKYISVNKKNDNIENKNEFDMMKNTNIMNVSLNDDIQMLRKSFNIQSNIILNQGEDANTDLSLKCEHFLMNKKCIKHEEDNNKNDSNSNSNNNNNIIINNWSDATFSNDNSLFVYNNTYREQSNILNKNRDYKDSKKINHHEEKNNNHIISANDVLNRALYLKSAERHNLYLLLKKEKEKIILIDGKNIGTRYQNNYIKYFDVLRIKHALEYYKKKEYNVKIIIPKEYILLEKTKRYMNKSISYCNNNDKNDNNNNNNNSSSYCDVYKNMNSNVYNNVHNNVHNIIPNHIHNNNIYNNTYQNSNSYEYNNIYHNNNYNHMNSNKCPNDYGDICNYHHSSDGYPQAFEFDLKKEDLLYLQHLNILGYLIIEPMENYYHSCIEHIIKSNTCLVTNISISQLDSGFHHLHITSKTLSSYFISYTFLGDEFLPNPNFIWPPISKNKKKV
ncbi:conserved Plasmodium protein, unknown function [Plasmodium gaboni]|uniref:Tetratricopeptide repeat protein n=1 Tax=Plasmodium gaboni TaxID=647221 RepID=A0ABY1UM84_9APIC|nr:conserved Plasmodium protein, unknown function [Plasmodium gaboni]